MRPNYQRYNHLFKLITTIFKIKTKISPETFENIKMFGNFHPKREKYL